MSKSVVIVAYDDVQLLDVAGPSDVLDAATKVLAIPADERHSIALDTAVAIEAGAEGYESVIATPTGRAVRTLVPCVEMFVTFAASLPGIVADA